MSVGNYHKLKIWQISMQLVESVYELTLKFPKSEQYGLTSQVRRAAVSMPSNIAEGNVRDSRKEYLHFLSVALGSLAEVETQLQLSSRLGFVSLDEIEEMLDLIQLLARMIRGLQRNIKSKIS